MVENIWVENFVYKSEIVEVWLILLIVLQKLLNNEKDCAECRRGDDYEDLDKDDREHESIRFWI